MSKQKSVAAKNFANDATPREDFIPEAGADFVVTPYIEDLTNRAIAYLRVGYAVHLSGPAGTGKSTLAMHIASRLGQPCTLLHGDDEFKASDLLGRDTGYQKSSTIDNYISSIVKTEESVSLVWSSNRLTTACQKGHTLIYDEFTRSPATANNPFLSILEEGILNIPSSGREKGYIKVDPNFRAIFTSNPEEYVGVHKTQDALLDRMITIELEYPDQETEVAIVKAKSDRSAEDAEQIVRIVRAVREKLGGKNGPTVRAAIAIARILNQRECGVDINDPIFLITCKDVLTFHVSRQGDEGVGKSKLDAIIKRLGHDQDQGSEQPTSADEIGKPDSQQVDVNSVKDRTDGPTASELSQQHQSRDLANAQSRVPTSEDKLLEATLDLTRTVDQGLTMQPQPITPVAPNPADTSNAAFDRVGRDGGLPRPPSSSASQVIASPSYSSEKPASASIAVDPAQSIPRSAMSSHATSESGLSHTASPQQMLEAAVNRFIRPPQANASSSGTPGLISS